MKEEPQKSGKGRKLNMNTKIAMTLSAVFMGTAGIALTFAPDLILERLHVGTDKTLVLIMQIFGALYFSFALLNWMTRANLIGGIYNRPLALANVAHYSIAGLALVKASISNPDTSPVLWTATFVYAFFAITFGLILMRHPLKESEAKT